jgi:hypothetical protein
MAGVYKHKLQVLWFRLFLQRLQRSEAAIQIGVAVCLLPGNNKSAKE